MSARRIHTCPKCAAPLDDLVSEHIARAGSRMLPASVCPECYASIEGEDTEGVMKAAIDQLHRYWTQPPRETLREVLAEIRARCDREAAEYEKAIEMEGHGALLEFSRFIESVERRFGFKSWRNAEQLEEGEACEE